MNIQTWKKLIFVRKPIFGVEKYPQIHIVPKYIKLPRIAIFSIISDISNKKKAQVESVQLGKTLDLNL